MLRGQTYELTAAVVGQTEGTPDVMLVNRDVEHRCEIGHSRTAENHLDLRG